VLAANLPDHEAVVRSDPTDIPRSGYQNLMKIGATTRELGWTQYPFCAETLRREIDWLDSPAPHASAKRKTEAATGDAELKKRLDRLATDDLDPKSNALDQLFCRYDRDDEDNSKWDATWNPMKDWIIIVSLRALDPEQYELRELLSNRFELKIDDPIKLRSSINASGAVRLAKLIDAVAALDKEMDAHDGWRWKARRQAIVEMVERYSMLRAHPKLEESAIHILGTTIKDICDRTGLTAFYENILVPLIEAIAKSFALTAEPSRDTKENTLATNKRKSGPTTRGHEPD